MFLPYFVNFFICAVSAGEDIAPLYLVLFRFYFFKVFFSFFCYDSNFEKVSDVLFFLFEEEICGKLSRVG